MCIRVYVSVLYTHLTECITRVYSRVRKCIIYTNVNTSVYTRVGHWPGESAGD